jgi:glutathione S-transferase
MKIYGDVRSGNCDKVRYTADRLGLSYEWIGVDSVHGGTRTPAYLALFPQGQVPAVVLDDGRTLAQSNAIMRYLARGSSLLPDDAFAQAKIDEWLFWEQNSHEFFIANSIGHMTYKGQPKETREPWRVERGDKALDHMEKQLSGRDWLVGEAITIADIALFAYTRNADKGGFDMSARPHLRAWIARCAMALKLEKGSAL